MRRITFEAETLEELFEMVRHWMGADPKLTATDATVDGGPAAQESLEDVLARIHSPASRQFLREVAERALVGEALVIDDALRVRCGLPPGRSLVGVLGVANRTMRKRAGRDLISWDPRARGYRVSSEDARTILAAFGSPSSGAGGARAGSEPAGRSEGGERYH